MFKRLLSLLIAFVLVLGLSGCGKEKGLGADLYFPVPAQPRSLDPQLAEAPGSIVFANCFEGLVKESEDGSVAPGAAQSWEVSADKLTYTFHLRNNVKWHLMKNHAKVLGENYKDSFDTRVTAEDFVFALRRAVSPVTASPGASALNMIKNADEISKGTLSEDKLGVQAEDDFTLVITLAFPVESFLRNLYLPVCMPCNEKFFEATKGQYGLSDTNIICNGPFYVSSWSQDSYITMRKNKDYYSPSEVLPNSVSLRLNPDREKYQRLIQQGNYSAGLISFWPEYAPQLSSDTRQIEVQNEITALCFNAADKHLKSRNLRIALCMAVDKQALGPELEGREKIDRIIPLACLKKEGYGSMLTSPGAALGVQRDKAKELLDKTFDELEIKHLSLTIICPPFYEKDMRILIQSLQKTFGVDLSVSVETLEPTELLKRVESGQYQIALAPLRAADSEVKNFLQTFTTKHPLNFSGYSSSTYDNMAAMIQTAGTDADAVQFCLKAQEELILSGTIIPIFEGAQQLVLGKGVSGIFASPAGERIYFANARRVK